MVAPAPVDPDPFGDRLFGWSLAAAAVLSFVAAVALIVTGG